MCFPGPRNIDPNIRERLAQSTMVPVYLSCCELGFCPGVTRLTAHIGASIEQYIEDVALCVQDDWPDFVSTNYPDFDLEAGGDQGEKGNWDEIWEEYAEDKALSALGCCYENEGYDLREDCQESILSAMRLEGVNDDPDSAKALIIEAAGDEGLGYIEDD